MCELARRESVGQQAEKPKAEDTPLATFAKGLNGGRPLDSKMGKTSAAHSNTRAPPHSHSLPAL